VKIKSKKIKIGKNYNKRSFLKQNICYLNKKYETTIDFIDKLYYNFIAKTIKRY
jgi:hypothetical protein